MTEEAIMKIVLDEAFHVHKKIGPGMLESVYKTCLAYRLQKRGLLLETEKPVLVFFEEVKMDCGYRADILVEQQVIVETKSIEGIGPPVGGTGINVSSLFGTEVWFDSEF